LNHFSQRTGLLGKEGWLSWDLLMPECIDRTGILPIRVGLREHR
jgi:hypothetical protein